MQRTSGARGFSPLVGSVSAGVTPSIDVNSLVKDFLSEISGVEDRAPKLGEAMRELVFEGSRLAVRAAFKRFSASSASLLS
jgi:hypothetical protein